ncbi:hypothetical protein ACN47E_001793 [Coniothyrium glycines]
MSCKHTYLHLTPSPFAELAGYEQPDTQALAAAETRSGRRSKDLPVRSSSTFPGPLVLPHDDLNYDPDCKPQNFKSWATLKQRNKMTNKKRSTIYVASVPEITQDVGFMNAWTMPERGPADYEELHSPDTTHFVEYLKAFYHGVNVEILPSKLSWTPWENLDRGKWYDCSPAHVGLTQQEKSTTRIRVRYTPSKVFSAQLNLNDILDTAIAMLPADAYALLILVDHDIYESDDDDFCCGRAYGGSRVAVVQTARYNPMLDERAGIDRTHMWPMSHCKKFVDELCAAEDMVAQAPTPEQRKWSKQSAMRSAVNAGSRFSAQSDDANLQALWFARLARTVSHELGHCFGIAHCVYYACNMQGTAGIKEDLRQPPYLCPIDEAKVCHAIVDELQRGKEQDKVEWARRRCEALGQFCQSLHDRELSSAMWAGLEAWLAERLKQIE